MTINQAFEILSDIAGPHVARIVLDAIPTPSRWRLWRVARQLRAGVPVAKIIHNKWFYGLKFYTNKWTLDPRPDSETLVAAVLDDCAQAPHISIADLGTGTGCIICAIAKNMNATGVALEKSRHAARVARKNVRDLGLANAISVRRGDFGRATALAPAAFDVIVSNPPYIAVGDPRVDAGAMHDPKMALYARDGGLAAYKEIATTAKIWLKPGGRIYLEIGVDMAGPVTEIFQGAGWTFVRSARDLGGITRVLVFSK